MANIKTIKEMLMRAIFEVFEKVFFVFAEPVKEAAVDDQLRASIRFSGPMDGAIQLILPEALAKIMAKNMLNLDDKQVTDTIIEDCVKECLNMICGSFVRKVDPDHVFHLTIPGFERIAGRPDDQASPSGSSLRLVYDTEGGAFAVKITAPGSL